MTHGKKEQLVEAKDLTPYLIDGSSQSRNDARVSSATLPEVDPLESKLAPPSIKEGTESHFGTRLRTLDQSIFFDFLFRLVSKRKLRSF